MPRLLLILLVAVAACRSGPTYAPPEYGNMAAAKARLEAAGRAGASPRDEALFLCELASASLCTGDEEGAFRALHGASRIMGTLESSSGENMRAILGSEATKTWKGDPHERCMGALYKGLLYWRRGDIDNASACFKNGLFADGFSEMGEHQQDFAVLSYLLGWANALKGRGEQTRFSFEEARRNAPENPWFGEADPARASVLVVADIGRGPKKYADGSANNLVKFAPRTWNEGGIEILSGGRSLGRSASGADLYLQAVTRGKKVLDGIRKGKAVFKEGSFAAGAILLHEGARRDKGGMAAVGAGLLLLSVLTNAQADTRHWTLLPGEVHVLPLSLPPGRHDLEIRVLDKGGRPIPGWSRTCTVAVQGGPGALYYVRPMPGQGIHALLDQSHGVIQ
ncbi:MAG: hypothetical protein HC813_00250 [Planctomycetes bacterium]|nr:hypothetical protein [Planctomycetota bacterium]